jgi:hypothetical protein
MSTRKLIGTNASLAGALLVGLLSHQAGATEELVVYGTAAAGAATAVSVEQRLFQAEVEQYIRSFNEQLRLTLEQDLKRQVAPKVELASSVVHTRG